MLAGKRMPSSWTGHRASDSAIFNLFMFFVLFCSLCVVLFLLLFGYYVLFKKFNKILMNFIHECLRARREAVPGRPRTRLCFILWLITQNRNCPFRTHTIKTIRSSLLFCVHYFLCQEIPFTGSFPRATSKNSYAFCKNFHLHKYINSAKTETAFPLIF